MQISNADTISSCKNNVIVKVSPRSIIEDGVFLGDDGADAKGTEVGLYAGDVVNIGPKATDPGECPEVETGDVAIFSKFAGTHIAVKGTDKYKVIPGSQLMGRAKHIDDIQKGDVEPYSGRLLLEIDFVDVDDNGVVLSEKDGADPRLEDVTYGTILLMGSEVEDFEIGDRVGFLPHCGETVRKPQGIKKKELKFVNYRDIEFTI